MVPRVQIIRVGRRAQLRYENSCKCSYAYMKFRASRLHWHMYYSLCWHITGSWILSSAPELALGCRPRRRGWACVYCIGWSAPDLAAQNLWWHDWSFQWRRVWAQFEWAKVTQQSCCCHFYLIEGRPMLAFSLYLYVRVFSSCNLLDAVFVYLWAVCDNVVCLVWNRGNETSFAQPSGISLTPGI